MTGAALWSPSRERSAGRGAARRPAKKEKGAKKSNSRTPSTGPRPTPSAATGRARSYVAQVFRADDKLSPSPTRSPARKTPANTRPTSSANSTCPTTSLSRSSRPACPTARHLHRRRLDRHHRRGHFKASNGPNPSTCNTSTACPHRSVPSPRRRHRPVRRHQHERLGQDEGKGLAHAKMAPRSGIWSSAEAPWKWCRARAP